VVAERSTALVASDEAAADRRWLKRSGRLAFPKDFGNGPFFLTHHSSQQESV
jgi:hypothetical protein